MSDLSKMAEELDVLRTEIDAERERREAAEGRPS
jgi:hypothetical protein